MAAQAQEIAQVATGLLLNPVSIIAAVTLATSIVTGAAGRLMIRIEDARFTRLNEAPR